MHTRTTRHVSLPLSSEKCWRILRDTKTWSQFFPEIDHAVLLKNGQVKLAMRLGNRRGVLKALVQRDESLRSLHLVSASEEVDFQLSAHTHSSGPNSQICIDCQFSTPEKWTSFPRKAVWSRNHLGLKKTASSGSSKKKSGFASRKRAIWGLKLPRLVRLVASFLLFALSALGIRLLPGLSLPSTLAAIAYAFLGMFFLVAAALLSGRHKRTTAAKGVKLHSQ